MSLKYTYIMYLEYRICFLVTNIMLLNEYQNIRMVCFSPNLCTKFQYRNVLL